MTGFEINYSKTEALASQASKVSKELKSYSQEIGEMERKLSDGTVTEFDNWGYVSAALTEARKKASIADEKSSVYSRFSTALTNLCTTAKQSDSLAAANIERIFDARIGKRTIFQKIGDFIYNSYINFLDKVSGYGELGKKVADFIKNGTDWLENAFERVKNWFKYGVGKYVYNIAMAVVDTLTAFASIVGAVAVLTAGAPAWFAGIALIGVACFTAHLFMQAEDSSIAIEENIKALSLAKDGNTTAARYYGEIEGFKDKTTHYDYGDSEDNAIAEKNGELYDGTKTVLKKVGTICTTVAGFANLGLVETANGEKDFNFMQAIKGWGDKAKDKIGITNADQNGGVLGQGFNPFKGIFKNKNEKTLTDLGFGKGIGKVLDGAKAWSKTDKAFDAYSKLKEGGLSGYETVDKGMDVIGVLPAVEAVTDDIWKLISSQVKIVQTLAG